MSGSTPTNSQAVDFEKQQAAEAKQKEAERQQRLQTGQDLITKIFEGAPVMGTRKQNFDWGSFKAPTQQTQQAAAAGGDANWQTAGAQGVPEGFTVVQVDDTPAATPQSAMSGFGPSTGQGPAPAAASARGGVTGMDAIQARISPPASPAGVTGMDPQSAAFRQRITSPSGSTGVVVSGDNTFGHPQIVGASPNGGAGGGGGKSWALKGPDGKIYRMGDQFSYDSSYDTGQRSGGFGDDFYNAYKQKYLDFYQPDETKQYNEAKRDLGYSLARAGLTNSSVAGDKQGDLAYQDSIQKAKIVNDANTATGQLQSQVLGQKQSLINQLYATEDPTLTANLAQSAASGLKLSDPTLTPAASLFTPALIGATSAFGAATSPYGGGPLQNNRSTVANANTSSGRAYS